MNHVYTIVLLFKHSTHHPPTHTHTPSHTYYGVNKSSLPSMKNRDSRTYLKTHAYSSDGRSTFRMAFRFSKTDIVQTHTHTHAIIRKYSLGKRTCLRTHAYSSEGRSTFRMSSRFSASRSLSRSDQVKAIRYRQTSQEAPHCKQRERSGSTLNQTIIL